VKRVINGGGIPQKNDVLNQVYANVLGRPVLVPSKSVISLGSAIFAFMAARTFDSIEQAQDKICPPNRTFTPIESARRAYEELYPLYNQLYFTLGQRNTDLGRILPSLISVAESAHQTSTSAGRD
jgi:L-ribulokinase